MHAFRLDGRRALVTGAAQGIGRAIALTLHEAGAEVLAHDKDATRLEALPSGREGMVPLVADLATHGAANSLLKAARSRGSIDILILCASVQRRRPWKEALSEEADVELAVNFDASRLLLAELAPEMAQRGWGRILAIGSVQELRPRADMAVYAALKAAQTNMVLTLAKELAPHGVTCNILSPGVIETDRNAQALSQADYRSAVLAGIPVGRLGNAEDCVGPALLFCSDAGAYITGQRLLVDGGMLL